MARLLGRLSDDRTRVGELRSAADQLVVLVVTHEAEAATATAALEAALTRESEIAEIEADAVTGIITEDEAEQRKTEIAAAVAEARGRTERSDRIVTELRRRLSAAGQEIADEVLRAATAPLGEAQEALRQAEVIAAQRRAALEAEQEQFALAAVEADELRAQYDDEFREERAASDRLKREKFEWAFRQPRIAIEQLPLAWRAEAYAAYDALQAEIDEAREEHERRRYGGVSRAGDGLWRESGWPN